MTRLKNFANYHLQVVANRHEKIKVFRMNSHNYIKPLTDENNEQTEGIQLLTYAVHVLF